MFEPTSASSPAKPSFLPPCAPVAARGEASEAFRVSFPQGLPGFPDVTDYLLRPAGTSHDLLMLAAVDHADLRFLALPYVPGWLPLDHEVIVAAAETVGIQEEHLAVVMMLNLHRPPASARIEATVNLRAPILIDVLAGTASQCVLPRPDYPIRHPLPLVRDPHQADRPSA